MLEQEKTSNVRLYYSLEELMFNINEYRKSKNLNIIPRNVVSEIKLVFQSLPSYFPFMISKEIYSHYDFVKKKMTLSLEVQHGNEDETIELMNMYFGMAVDNFKSENRESTKSLLNSFLQCWEKKKLNDSLVETLPSKEHKSKIKL